uniref:Uncharacterized protein n=1 Tax=Zea mays TaxID=4577 RepID=C4J1J1_MAIZE|nr:unknown [Zea mays]
MPIIVIGS